MLERSREIKRQYDEKIKSWMAADEAAAAAPTMHKLRNQSMKRVDASRQRAQGQRTKELAELDAFDATREAALAQTLPVPGGLSRPGSAGTRLAPLAHRPTPPTLDPNSDAETPRLQAVPGGDSDLDGESDDGASTLEGDNIDQATGDGDADVDGEATEATEAGDSDPTATTTMDAANVSAIREKRSNSATTSSPPATAALDAARPLRDEAAFVDTIRRRKDEDETARRDRERRRRRLVIENMEAQQRVEARQADEQLLATLLRQSKRERRVAQRLVHLRREKDIMQANRAFRQSQAEERRRRDFQEALDREAALEIGRAHV